MNLSRDTSVGSRTEVEKRLASLTLGQLWLRYEHILSLILFALSWSALLIYSGTLNSGYHLIDDWELPAINESLHESGLFAVTTDIVRMDLMIRFRPWYYTQRIFALWLTGFNITALSALQLATVAATSLVLYLFSRRIGFGVVNSLLFGFLTFVGPQAAIWWRLGTSESIGIFWFALGLLYMAKAVEKESRIRRAHTLIALTSFVIASLTKESFMVLLPVMSLAWLMLYCRNHQAKPLESLRACAMPVLSMAMVCLAEVAAVFFKSGTSSIGYAGFDTESTSIRSLYQTLKGLVSFSNGDWLVLLLIVFTCVFLASFQKGFQWRLIREPSSVALLIALFTASQVLVYAKSGIYERYLVPGTMAIAFLVIYLIAKIDFLLRNERLRLAVSTLLLAGTVFVLTTQAATAWAAAKVYASDGVTFNQALQKVDMSTRKDDVVVLLADPARDFEATIGTREYFRVLFKRSNVFIFPIWTLNEDRYSAFERKLGETYETDLGDLHLNKLADKSRIKAILAYPPGAADSAFRQNKPDWFNPESFVRSEFGQFVVYTAL